MTEKEKKRNKHLLKKFGITLEEYNEMLADQGMGCWICGWQPAPGQRSLSVDHDHKVSKVRVLAEKGNGEWRAWAEYRGDPYEARATLRKDAVAEVKRLLKRASCRGALCWRHNRAIEMFNDDPRLLKRAAFYLERLER